MNKKKFTNNIKLNKRFILTYNILEIFYLKQNKFEGRRINIFSLIHLEFNLIKLI